VINIELQVVWLSIDRNLSNRIESNRKFDRIETDRKFDPIEFFDRIEFCLLEMLGFGWETHFVTTKKVVQELEIDNFSVDRFENSFFYCTYVLVHPITGHYKPAGWYSCWGV
jgi:hypothetical protein